MTTTAFRNPDAPRSAPQQGGMYWARKANRNAAMVDNPAAPAWGTISFAGNPSPGDTVTLNGHAVAFGSPVAIGTDLDTTLATLADYAGAHVAGAAYSVSGNTLVVLSAAPGDTSYTLAASHGTVSAATLQLQQNRMRSAL